jgi:hypothetical protein
MHAAAADAVAGRRSQVGGAGATNNNNHSNSSMKEQETRFLARATWPHFEIAIPAAGLRPATNWNQRTPSD